MTPLDSFNFDDAMAATGQRSEASRRLSDKILAAFTMPMLSASKMSLKN